MLDEAASMHEAHERAAAEDMPAWLLCAGCGARITPVAAATSFDGGHTHRFTNPHGIAFTIALYEEAPGCVHDAWSTDDFSWFVGYAWRVASCGGCRTHLGWAFECIGAPGPGEPPGFEALVVDRLRRGS